MNSNTVIVVLGMHRSGTSAVTRSLELLGVGLGEKLHPANFDNPTGFWEDEDCLSINEQLLAVLASAYDQLDIAWENILDLPAVAGLRAQAGQIIKTKLEQAGGIWGFKDPRTCRLVEFWQAVFADVGCNAKYVIALRNPTSVAASLHHRNGIPFEKSYLLWLQHVLPSVMKTVGLPRVFIDYDELLASPYEQLARISTRLDLPMPPREDGSVAAFEKEFLNQDLRHSSFTYDDLNQDPRCAPLVKRAYKTFMDCALERANPDSEVVLQTQTAIADELASLRPIVDYVNALEHERKDLWTEIAANRIQLDALQNLYNQNSLLIPEHEQAKLVMLAERNQIVQAINLQMTLLSDELKAAIEKSEKIELSNAQIQTENSHLRTRIVDLESELAALLNSKSWTVTKPLRLVRRMIDTKSVAPLTNKLEVYARSAWHNLPMDHSYKRRLKNYIFKNFSFALSNTQAYRGWKAQNSPDDNGFESAHARNFVAANGRAGSDYVGLTHRAISAELPVRTIAFYLPQFHAIKENDEWWGSGFTEWTNVKPAASQFDGHYQPHMPGELGYYNLLDKNIQRRQIELAKLYGVGGFCFYYYWFDGHRLLEQPIENYLADSSLDHPFCLCWANENWSRRWDGNDSQILIGQNHSEEDDLAFAADVARYMSDSRYIKIDGKPLLVIYRPSLLPSAKTSSERWRTWFRANGFGEIYLAYTQSFEAEDPRKYGFDAAIEFPPNNSNPPNITSEVKNASPSFQGTVYDWNVFLERSRNYVKPAYTLFRSVCPSWDNTARRKNKGTIFANSTPAKYQQWLENAIGYTKSNFSNPEERFVFINAWNEWAEGAHLEPDDRYGYAWLQATRCALTGEKNVARRAAIAVVSHDAHPHGAQFLALGIARTLKADFKYDVTTVLLGEGRLKPAFEVESTVIELFQGDGLNERSLSVARELFESGIRVALVNTTVSGSFVRALKDNGISCICLVHELAGVIRDNNLGGQASEIAECADAVVFPAEIVRDAFVNVAPVPASKAVIRPQGLWRRNMYRFDKAKVRAEIRSKLEVPPEQKLVLTVGYADRRKGIDLFVKAGLSILKTVPDTTFIWIGHWDEALRPEIEAEIKGNEHHFKFLGYEPDTAKYHVAADVYALTSREDPFPNVVLESLDAAVPVAAFAGTGGGAELVATLGGRNAPELDVELYAEEVVRLLTDSTANNSFGQDGANLVDTQYAFRSYLHDLLKVANIQVPKISVVVPNFNYEKYIEARLDSIVSQSLPIYELIVLDDASTDNSIELIKSWMVRNSIECRLVVNQVNSGNVFDQWAKGISLAKGDYLWIAEADDLSSPDFLETVIQPMLRSSEVVLSYCESKQIDALGNTFSRNYSQYKDDVSLDHWHQPYVNAGADEIVSYLSIKNTIPNVSAVMFKRDVISKVFAHHHEAVREMKRAGDWLVYIHTLEEGLVAYTPHAANSHRRHGGSVIGADVGGRLLREIELVQEYVDENFSLPDNVRSGAKVYRESIRAALTIGKE
ncbi:glycoside hydrolase family 99-like domain-containing protein [Pseudomonas syringae]|nr:glycoside hydrolase family 99-like domain-containing protein [Pseudomonas syringae]